MGLSRYRRLSIATVIAVFTTTLALTGSAVAQDADDPAAPVEPPRMAEVRFLHAAQAGPLDLLIDGTLAVEAFGGGQISDYVQVPVGRQRLELVDAGLDPDEARAANEIEPAAGGYAAATVKLQPNQAYTVVAMADAAGLSELRTFRDRPKPRPGKTQVRIIELCSNCGPVEFLAGKSRKPLVRNLHYLQKMESPYVAVKPGALQLRMRESGSKNTVARFAPITLEPGTSNTIYATGWVINDTMALVPALDAALTQVRVANSAVEPHRVDVYMDGRKMARGLLQERAGPFRNALSGEHLVQVVDAGASPADGVLSEGIVTLQPGATAAIVVGMTDPVYVAPVPPHPAMKAKTARMRFTNIGQALPPFALWIDGRNVVEGLEFGESTDYIDKVPGAGEIQLSLPGGGGSYSIGSMDFMAPGSSYSGYIAGSPENDDVTLMVIADPAPRKK